VPLATVAQVKGCGQAKDDDIRRRSSLTYLQMKKYCADKRWHIIGWIKERVQDWYDIQLEKRIQQVDRLLKDY